MCGHAVSEHDRQVRFELPDPVLHSVLQLDVPGTWLSHEDANKSVMMQVPHVSPFVRALLPVHLNGGHTVTFGVWVAISPDDLQRTFAVWWEDEYAGLELDGFLANDITPWNLVRTPVKLAVRNIDHTPYCVKSTDRLLESVISESWPHEEILAPFL